MQRTDWIEVYLEKFSSLPLTWENVFRGTQYVDKTKKEVVDLLLVLRNEGILISLKCQEDPTKRRGDKLTKWINKKAKDALKQLKGGIRTSQTRGYWCEHPRRGRVSFRPKEIRITQAIVLVETLEVVRLADEFNHEIEAIPISYFSVNDFLNIISELRTIYDIQRYLKARKSLPKEVLTTAGLEKTMYRYYILNNGIFPNIRDLSQVVAEVKNSKKQIDELIRLKSHMDRNSYIIENVSDALSKRPDGYGEGLDERSFAKYDSPSNRKNYILMQNELCDLVSAERRKIGEKFFDIMKKVEDDEDEGSMAYQAISLDSKPHFQYVLSASRGSERQELIKRSELLIRGALAEYNKERGMIITYNRDIDNFEVVLVDKFEKNESDVKIGNSFFRQLKMEDIPIETV
jgi:hypothetical protein